MKKLLSLILAAVLMFGSTALATEAEEAVDLSTMSFKDAIAYVTDLYTADTNITVTNINSMEFGSMTSAGIDLTFADILNEKQVALSACEYILHVSRDIYAVWPETIGLAFEFHATASNGKDISILLGNFGPDLAAEFDFDKWETEYLVDPSGFINQLADVRIHKDIKKGFDK